MGIQIDLLSTTPIYLQIRDQVIRAIARAELRRGDALAPVRALGSALGVNPATVVKAYDLLRAEGLVGANAKSGTFVARDQASGPPDSAFVDDFTQRLTTLLAEGRARGMTDLMLGEYVSIALHNLNGEDQ